MRGYASTAETAEAVGVTARTVRYHAQHGHLPGSEMIGEPPWALWLIPVKYSDPETYAAIIGKAGPKRNARGSD